MSEIIQVIGERETQKKKAKQNNIQKKKKKKNKGRKEQGIRKL